MRRVALIALLLVAPAPARAQEQELAEALARADLPAEVLEHLLDLVRDPATTRLRAPARIEAGEVLAGDVAALGGPLTVAGRIEGELLVVRGNVEFLDGGEVRGDVTVVEGEALGVDRAALGGTLMVYGETWVVADEAERERARRDWRERRQRQRFGPNVRFGDSRLTLRTGRSYNRIEGLPILFGPIIETGGSNPFRVEALAILRTESELFDESEMGYTARIEQFAGGRRALRFGASARSVVEPIEDWGLTDLETSLATLLFHTDYRDYYEREGWSGYLRLTPWRGALDLLAEYRDEEHATLPVADPWALTQNDDPWRPQPLVGEGRLRSVVGRLQVDTRDDEKKPMAGWFLTAQVQRGVDGDLRIPEHLTDIRPPCPPPGCDATIPETPVDSRFTSGFLDLRRYQRIDLASSLAFRVVAGGSLTERALPPQLQHAFGGAGSLPAYRLFEGACGARQSRAIAAGREEGETQEFHPAYGCDRFALAQLEFRGRFDLDFDFGQDWWDEGDWDFDVEPRWVVFFDAGRGWALPDGGTAVRADTRTFSDAGVGLLLGGLGLYAALPLSDVDDDRGINFFVRLGRRF